MIWRQICSTTIYLQKWILIILGAFVVLFVLQSVFVGEYEHKVENIGYNESDGKVETSEGLALMQSNGCITCHGSDLKGTGMGPALVSLNKYYDREKLINYMRNPAAYMSEGRLKEMKEKFRTIMPAYNNVDVKDLGKISDYLLEQK